MCHTQLACRCTGQHLGRPSAQRQQVGGPASFGRACKAGNQPAVLKPVMRAPHSNRHFFLPASSMERQPPQTEAIEEDPLDSVIVDCKALWEAFAAPGEHSRRRLVSIRSTW